MAPAAAISARLFSSAAKLQRAAEATSCPMALAAGVFPSNIATSGGMPHAATMVSLLMSAFAERLTIAPAAASLAPGVP